jgi:hypothetical protein
MKRILFLTMFVMGVSYSAWASSCASGALSAYEVPLFSCNIGDLVFSNFASSGIDTTTTVSDIPGPEAGLQFGVDLTALGPGSETPSIDYVVTCNGCTLDDWALQTGGAGSLGNGGVSVIEFSTPGLLTQFTEGPGNVTSGTGSATFAPTGAPLSITTSIALGGGTSGTVTTLGSVTNLFSQTSTPPPPGVPEPSLLILSAGLLSLLPFARRKFLR